MRNDFGTRPYSSRFISEQDLIVLDFLIQKEARRNKVIWTKKLNQLQCVLKRNVRQQN